MTAHVMQFTVLERRLLDEFQRDLPLSPTPYADMAGRLGVSEDEVLQTLASLKERGAVGRVGAVLKACRLGASTLAAMAVPQVRLEEVAVLVSSYREVNHNYEREHAFNLWFVVAAPNRERIDTILGEIETATGIAVMDLPLVEEYHIDLAFRLWR